MIGRYWLAALLSVALAFGVFGVASAEMATMDLAANLTSEEVVWLEEQLYRLGFLTSADGVFDAGTGLALESLQRANALEITGQPDEATLQKLRSGDVVSRQGYLQRFIGDYRAMAPMKNGDFSGQVQVMQHRLIDYGYYSGKADGVFSDATQAAVERFQMVNGLPVTGIADGMTMMRLMADAPVTWQGFLSEMSAAPGDMGLNVYALQRRLAEMGYYKGDCTGNYSDLTSQAVAQFQADNALEGTGSADAATWAALYSNSAVTRRQADVLRRGDSGERVAQVRQRLAAMGYLSAGDGDSYDYAVETAVRLFQMANDLPATGYVDGQTLSAILSGAALMLRDEGVQQRFNAAIEGRSPATRSAIADLANRMLGEAFNPDDDALYPGFSLAQYVCVAAGLPVTQPEALIQLAATPVASALEIEAGNVVTLQASDEDSVTMLLAIGAGEGRVIYATPQTGWVVLSYIDQLNSDSIFRWAEDAEAAQ